MKAALLLITCLACAHTPARASAPTHARACLGKVPAVEDLSLDGPAADCPRPFAFCMRGEPAARMLVYIHKLREYADKAAKCAEVAP